jgi:hypothetical protein
MAGGARADDPDLHVIEVAQCRTQSVDTLHNERGVLRYLAKWTQNVGSPHETPVRGSAPCSHWSQHLVPHPAPVHVPPEFVAPGPAFSPLTAAADEFIGVNDDSSIQEIGDAVR